MNTTLLIKYLLGIVPVKVFYLDYRSVKREGIIEVHKSLKGKVKNIFDSLLKLRFEINQVCSADNREDKEIIVNNETTGYNFRKVLGTNKLSNHSFGVCVDINPKDNVVYPSLMQDIYNKNPDKGVVRREVIDVFKNNGFDWGGTMFGDFKDTHHFEHKLNNRQKFLKKLFQIILS